MTSMTSMTASGLAAPGGGTGTVSNTYSYDEAGRLTGWNNGTAHAYGYDKAGNLTSNNGATFTYDARNQLTSDGSNSYTYAANGDVTSQTSAQGTVTSFTSDAFGQQVTAGTSSYGYDALGRLLTAGTPSAPVSLTYSGMGDQVASDPSATYSRDPSGSVTGVDTAAGVKTVAVTDQHMDLVGMVAPAGTALAGSATFDPWGNVIAKAGTAVQAGFQGGWTDPATGQVSMGSRFYDPAAGQFLNQDSVTTSAQGDPAAGSDLHAYVNDSPVTGTDPSGHCLVVCLSTIVNKVKAVVKTVKKAAKAVVNTVKKVVARTVAVARKVVTAVKHVASVVVAKVSDAYHAAATYATRVVKAVAKTAVRVVKAAVHVVNTAVHRVVAVVEKIAKTVKKAVNTTVKAATSFAKKHSAVTTNGSPVLRTVAPVGRISCPSWLCGTIVKIGDNIASAGSQWLQQWRTGWSGKTLYSIQQGSIYVTTPREVTYTIPDTSVSRTSDNGKGIVFQRPGANGNADMTKIMEPTSQYPNGYSVVYNSYGQAVDRLGNPGNPLGRAATHLPEDELGDFPDLPVVP
jgi:RHS repeat-associated protein